MEILFWTDTRIFQPRASLKSSPRLLLYKHLLVRIMNWKFQPLASQNHSPACNIQYTEPLKTWLVKNQLDYQIYTSIHKSLLFKEVCLRNLFNTCKPRDNHIRPTWCKFKTRVTLFFWITYVQIYCNKLPSNATLQTVTRTWIYTIKS